MSVESHCGVIIRALQIKKRHCTTAWIVDWYRQCRQQARGSVTHSAIRHEEQSIHQAACRDNGKVYIQGLSSKSPERLDARWTFHNYCYAAHP